MPTGIIWTDETWNPVVGCTQVSPGCAHCYAKVLHDQRHKAHREGKLQAPQYAEPFERVQLKPERLDYPRSWRRPRRIFVNSVSDLFHPDVPDFYIADVFAVMAEAHWHTYQILTKRPARMLRWFTEYLPETCSGEKPAPVWPLPNVWLGVSVENQRFADERIPLLLRVTAAVRWLSCEPLLGPVNLAQWLAPAVRVSRGGPPEDRAPLTDEEVTVFSQVGRAVAKMQGGAFVDWVVCGGESGPGHRPLNLDHARSLRDQCVDAGVPFLFKQVGGKTAKSGGRELDGRTWDEYPRTGEVAA
ncbi:MAG TPA: phage Gp37/Gp68 family protein [Candidatus Limnocylindria bacterium]|nr:phage Gp37/Gp68 family protein [Candidatus Limnocylindria bacterium]